MATNRLERRLAAILAADMVGYSRLMEIDEVGTIARQRSHRDSLIDPAIAAHRGRVVKTTGDGLLVEFASAVDAIECAVHVQQAIDALETEQPDDRRIHYRIGINVGDIVIDGEDILGDGVNIAARLEGVASPGGIAISANAFEQTQGDLRAAFADGGEHRVKNISRPVRVWRWTAGGVDDFEATTSTQKPDQTLAAILARIEQPTIAVLPFANMSRNEDLDFFCEGLAESLISDLSRGTRLSIAARNSSFAFRGGSNDITETAKSLGVRYLIEGSVQAMGSRMRVNAQLIDSVSGDHIWADRFDRTTDDLFEVQDELCDAILVETDALLSTGNPARLQQIQTQDPQAALHLRRTNVYFSMNDVHGYTKAMEEADKAVAVNPDIPIASIFRAASRTHLVMNGWATNDKQLLEEGIEICDLAIKRIAAPKQEPSVSGLYLARGMAKMASGRFDEAMEDARLGTQITSNLAPPARHIFARCLLGSGGLREAYRETITAIQNQPNPFPFFLVTLGIICLTSSQNADAVQVLKKYRELAPNLAPGAALLAAALAACGRTDEAKQAALDVQQLDPTLTIESVLRPYPTKDPTYLENVVYYLEAAGIPHAS